VIIDNATHWDTRQLRAIILRALKLELDAAKIKRMTVRVRYGNRRYGTNFWVSGRAHVGGNVMRLFVCGAGIDRTDLAATTVHEAAHCRGLNHNQMHSLRYERGRTPEHRRLHRARYDWAENYPLERKGACAIPKRSATIEGTGEETPPLAARETQ